MKIQNYDERDAGKVYIWALILPIIVSIIIGIALTGAPKDEEGKFIILKEIWFNYLLQIISALLLVGLYFSYTKSHNISYKACGITKEPNYLMVIICIVVGFSLCFFTDKFISLIAEGFKAIGININTSLNIPLSNFGEYVLAIVLVAICPAICEELIYRGIILNGLRKYGKWTAILLSALAFCLMHGNIAQFPYTFLLGVVLGYVMFETSSLILCIAIHFFNNATVLTQMYIEQTYTTPTINATYVVEAIALFVVAIAIVMLAFYLIAKIKNKTDVQQEPSKTQEKTEEENAQRKKNKEQKLLTKNEKFSRPEQTEVLVPKKKKLDSGLVMLLIGYAVAILLTAINMI